MEERERILFDALSEKQLYTKTYEEFVTQFSNEESRRKLHEALYAKQLYTKPYEDFDSQFFTVKKKEPSFLDFLESDQKSTADSTEQPRSLDESLIPQQPLPIKKKDTGSYAGDMLERIGAQLIDIATSGPKKLKFAKKLMDIPKEIAKKELSILGLSDEVAEKIASNIPFIKPEGIDASVKLSSAVWDKIGDTEGFKEIQNKANELREASARYDKLFSEYLKGKEYGKALGLAILSGAESLPITIEAALGGPAGLLDVGFYSASMQYDQLAANADMTEVQKISNALANGAFEILTEKLGSANYGKLLKKLYKTVGIEQAEVAIKGALKNWLSKMWKRFGIYTAPAGESIEEGINQFASNLTARITGEDIDRPLDYGVIDQMGSGFGGGTFFIGPGMFAQARAQYYEAKLKQKEKLAKEQAKAKEPSKTTDKGTVTTEVGALEVPEAVRKQFEEDNLSLSKEELKEMKDVEKKAAEEPTEVTEQPTSTEPVTPTKVISEPTIESITERAIKYGIIDRDRGTDVLDLIGNYDIWAKEDAKFKEVVDKIPKEEWEQLKRDAYVLRTGDKSVLKEPTMEEAIAEESGQVVIPVNTESIDADVIYLIGNANNLTSAEKNILWRQWKRGVMSLGDIQKYTTVDLEKINRGEIDKWARVVLGINEREYNKKKYKKIPVDDVNFEEVTQPTPAKVEKQSEIISREEERKTFINKVINGLREFSFGMSDNPTQYGTNFTDRIMFLMDKYGLSRDLAGRIEIIEGKGIENEDILNLSRNYEKELNSLLQKHTPAKVEEVPIEVKEEVKIEEPTKVKEPNIFNKQQVIESLLSEYPEEVREQVRNSFARAENFEEMATQAGFNSLGGGQYTRESVAKVQEDVQKPTEPISKPVEPLSTPAPPKVEEVAEVKEKGEEKPPIPPKKEKPTKEGKGKERERGYFKQLMESSVASEELKTELKESGLTYRVLSNKETVANIDYVLSQLGFEKALEEVKDLNSAISWATRRGLASRMVIHYDNIAMQAKEEGDLELAEEYLKKALDVADFVDKLGTATGQFNQYAGSSESFALLGKETNVKRTTRQIRKQRDKKIEDNKEDVKEKRDALREANKQSVDEVIKSKEFDDLKKRVLELEKKLEERKAPKPTKEQPKEKIQKEREYREDQWKKFKEAGKKSLPSSIAGLNSEQIEAIGNIVASYVKEGAYRVEDIVARLKRDFFKHTKQILSDEDARKLIPEKIGNKTFDEAISDNETDAIAKKLVQRVKALLDDPKTPKNDPIKQLIDTLFTKIEEKDTQKKEKPPKKTNVEKIAEALENKEQYRDVWEEAKEQVDFLISTNEELSEEQKSDQLKRLQSFFEEIIGRPYAERQVEGAVKEKIKDLGIEVDKIVRQHYTVADATGRTLSEKLIEELGISEEDAELLAGSVQQQFNKIATARKRSILLQGIKARAKRISNPKQAKLEWERLVELTNLGAFTNAEFAEAYADAWGFPKLTEQQSKDLLQLAERIQRKDGFKKDEAVQDYLNYIAKLPGLDLGEVALGVWYASILSGERTQFKNFFGNLANTISEMAVSMAYNAFTGNWSSIPFMINAMWNAKVMALSEGAYTMKTGYAPVRYGKIETGNYMERWRFRGKYNPLNAPKYVSRFMMAVDTFFYTGLKELRASEMAMKLARQENLEATEPSVSNWAKATEIMYGTNERRVEAELRADQEGLKGIEKKKRVWEIMERTRGEGIITESNNFASRGTYNYQPEGVVGEFTEMIGRFFGNRIFSVRNPATGKLINIHYGKFFVPFTRIIANVANVALDYVPYVGAVRVYKGSIGREGTGYYRKYTEEERKKLAVKVAIGTASMMSLALLSGEPDDPDEEPIMSITANGYGDYAKNEELKKSSRGFQPYSIKIGGKWYSYQYTPLFLALAPIGFIRDYQKLRKGKKAEMEAMDYWTSLLLSPVQVLSDMTVLTSVAGLLGAITEENFSTFDSYWKKFTSGTAKGFIYPKVVEQTKQLVDDIANNPKHYSSSWGGKVLKDMPVLQNRFPIQYNSAGEEVIWDAVQMTEKATSDEYFQFLYENGVTIGAPRQKGESCIIYDTEKKIERGMNDEEYMEFVKVSGRKIKERIMTEVVPKELSREDNKKEINNIKTDVRRLVKEELFGWSDFRVNNPKEWQILRDNQAVQIPQSSVKDILLGEEEDKIKFNKEDIAKFNTRAMELYSDMVIPTIQAMDSESRKRKLPTGETEYDYIINSLWTAAKQQAKAEIVEEKMATKK